LQVLSLRNVRLQESAHLDATGAGKLQRLRITKLQARCRREWGGSSCTPWCASISVLLIQDKDLLKSVTINCRRRVETARFTAAGLKAFQSSQ
jgi:hypothetical protein